MSLTHPPVACAQMLIRHPAATLYDDTLVTIAASGFQGDADSCVSQALDTMGRFSDVLAGCNAWLESGIALDLVADHTGPGTHRHAEGDLFYVLEGTFTIRVGDTWHTAPKGSFVRVPGGTAHDFENRGAVRAGLLNIAVPGGFEPEMPGIGAWLLEHPPGAPAAEDRSA